MPRYQPLARRNPSKKSRESKSKWTKEDTTGETDALSRGRSMTQVRRIGQAVAPWTRFMVGGIDLNRLRGRFGEPPYLFADNCH